MTTTLPSWAKLPLLLSLLILVPRVGLAAQDAPLATPDEEVPITQDTPSTSSDADIPGTDERAQLRLVDELGPVPRRQAPLGLRILAEAAAGSVTSVAGGLAGGLLGLGLCAASGGPSDQYGLGCLVAAIFGGGLGMGIGYPLGVWWGGEAIGGNGSLLLSIAGLGAGILVGGLVGALTLRIDPQGRVGGTVGGLLAVAGPILFYELSNRGPTPRRPAMASARPRIQPLLSVSSDGALLGLGGSF
jgi:hypothetical protein